MKKLADVETAESAARSSLSPVADACAKNTNAGGNYGSRATLLVDTSPDSPKTPLYFSVPSLVAPVQNANRRWHVTDASSNGPKVYKASSRWTESGVTWNTCPAQSGSAIAEAGALSTRWVSSVCSDGAFAVWSSNLADNAKQQSALPFVVGGGARSLNR